MYPCFHRKREKAYAKIERKSKCFFNVKELRSFKYNAL